MTDEMIVGLYFRRDEQAIAETMKKFGGYCMKISMSILNDVQESEENVNDAYLHTWNAIPPHSPSVLSSFIGKITRNLAINRYNKFHAQKRLSSEFSLSLDELDECVPDERSLENASASELRDALNAFLESQQQTYRSIFVRRYFYCDSIEEIAKRSGFSESKVKSVLFRLRAKLRKYLESEGFFI